MKPLFSILLMTLISFSSTAQTSISVKGGFNYSTAKASFGGAKQSTGYVPGANLAIQLKTAFDGPLHFSPYIAYTTRGYIIKSGNSAGDKTRTFINYIDLAPVLSLDFSTGHNNSFVIGVGPIAGLALSGKEKTTVSGISNTAKMHFSTSADYGLFDLGLHTSLGYHFNKLFVEIAYQYGFASINNNEENDKKNIQNRTLSLNLGYCIRSYK